MERINTLCLRYPVLEPCRDSLVEALKVLKDSFESGNKMLICGNGGSASDADHWCGELLKGFCSKRPLSNSWNQILGSEFEGKLQDALPCIPLTGFTALGTAFANDVDPHFIYAQLCWALGKEGDVLVGISTSGNADNVFHAAKVANGKGMKVITLTGESGGKLKDLANVAIRVPVKETFHVQELHLPVYHALCLELEDYFFVNCAQTV